MTLSIGPTFQTIVNAVLVNLGRSVVGNHSGSTQELVKGWVRRAHAILWNEADWIRTWITVDIPLTVDQAVYDVPDSIDPGDIHRINLIATDGKAWPIESGIRPNEQNSAMVSSRPLRIEIIDGDFRIWPAPSTEWATTMRIESEAVPPTFADMNDRVVVDSEALIMQAEIFGKVHYEMPGVDELRADLSRHMDNIRSKNSDGDTIQLGGRQAAAVKLGARLRNRISDDSNRFWGGDDWNPW